MKATLDLLSPTSPHGLALSVFPRSPRFTTPPPTTDHTNCISPFCTMSLTRASVVHTSLLYDPFFPSISIVLFIWDLKWRRSAGGRVGGPGGVKVGANASVNMMSVARARAMHAGGGEWGRSGGERAPGGGGTCGRLSQKEEAARGTPKGEASAWAQRESPPRRSCCPRPPTLVVLLPPPLPSPPDAGPPPPPAPPQHPGRSLRSLFLAPAMSSHGSSSSNNVVGAHYRVGKKIGEGSFGVIFEGASPPRRRPSPPFPALAAWRVHCPGQ